MTWWSPWLHAMRAPLSCPIALLIMTRTNPTSPCRPTNSVGHDLTRRTAAFGLLAFMAGCASSRRVEIPGLQPAVPADVAAHYGPRPSERHPVPAVDVSTIDPALWRQSVAYAGGEQPGTIVVDPAERFLYLVQERGQALRYGVGVGREGLEWSGRARVGRKAAWPRWTPTANMIARDPRNAEWAGGMDGGLANPLGARALYLYEGGRDTLYRLHGTNEPDSIGQALSSGCIRLFNQDIIDLHNRVPNGAAVLVRPA
jgi:lipoprotein-anchoring transpeptidase ErfK/SrfK